jgi:predicted nuclease of predicted toxin-antitoxin system
MTGAAEATGTLRLFIELYLDEDVDVLVADLLHARGFGALTTRDAGRRHATDAEQLAFAVDRQRALLTHNRADFEALHQTYLSSGQHHCGILIAVRHPAYEIVRRLLVILNAVTADEIQDQLRYL